MKLNKPIIFIGTGRSGSTYISGAVFSHKDIAFPSNYQEKFPTSNNINYLRHFFDNSLWRITTRGNIPLLLSKSFFLPSEAYSMWKYLVGKDVDFSRSFLLNDIATKDLNSKVNEYFEKIVSIQNRNRLGLKITGPSRIGFIQSLFPDAQFVWVKRNFYATLNSFLKVGFWKSRGYNKLWFTNGYSNDELRFVEEIKNSPELITAFQLHRIEQLTQFEIDNLGVSCLTINYDEFLKNHDDSLSSILNFLNLSDDKSCYDYINKNPIIISAKDPKAIHSESIISKIDQIRQMELPPFDLLLKQ